MGRVVAIVAAVVASAAGCVRAELVECANGSLCPAGTVCDEPHFDCVTPEQATACIGADDNELCLDRGACHHGICVAIECGNFLRDPDEACDDGNLLGGDGCAADCSSTERCGNGVIDAFRGETCDDGGLASHDGCDSQCGDEELGWTPLTQVAGIGAHELAAAAFDEGRGRLVVFGGEDPTNGIRYPETFEWDGANFTWLRHTPTVTPTPRTGAAMVYDVHRRVVMMFGGEEDLSGTLRDTWTWDGENWVALTSANAPPRRFLHAMAYDSRRRRTFMFGGRGVNGERDDTWIWDGEHWSELDLPTHPPARERTQMAYDPIRDQIVLFGGFAGTSVNDMWIFDGTTWAPIAPLGLPTARYGATLTFDPARGGLVLAGGGSTGPTQLWDGAQWTVIGSPGGGPMVTRRHHIAYYEPAIATVIAGFGAPNTFPTELMRLDDLVWNTVSPQPEPQPVIEAMSTYDVRRARVVMFGGMAAVSTNETWEHDGRTWIQRAPMTSPPPRRGIGMAYDVARARTVLWGGMGPDFRLWEWNGTDWTAIDPPDPEPPPRNEPAMVYDPVSQRVVMFGGVATPPTRLGDTWTWDGLTWQDVTPAAPAPSPVPRNGHRMVFDPVRGEIVLFGGADVSAARLGDTWTWTRAGGWRLRDPSASPPRRVDHAMAADPILGNVVLFGGTLGTVDQSDTWMWDGTTWERVFPDQPPPPQSESVIAYDEARRQFLLHGAEGTWRLQLRGVSPDDACARGVDRDGDDRVGCADEDCAALCAPECPVGVSCAGPRCGDGMCSSLESCRLCPGDCGNCPPRCGDSFCDGGELCPGDCP